MLIVDGHLDLAWNAIQWGRDLRSPVAAIRAGEARAEGPGRGRGTVALPELREAQVGVALATLLARATGAPVAGLDYATADEAGVVACEQLAYYRRLEREGLVVVLESARALERHVGAWQAGQQALGIVVSMEGADPIAGPGELDVWYDSGLRVIGLSHYGNGRYAAGTGAVGGLTSLGRALLPEMRELGMALDLTHLTDGGFYEAMDAYGGPVLASHSNSRSLVPGQRQIDDRQIALVAERHGVVGIAFDCWMLDAAWVKGQRLNPVYLTRIADQIDHVCQLLGSSSHVGIGSDLDGGFGREQSPADLDTIADLQRVPELLRQRGYAEADIARIAHGNWLELLSSVLR